jgi:hypothetical protein
MWHCPGHFIALVRSEHVRQVGSHGTLTQRFVAARYNVVSAAENLVTVAASVWPGLCSDKTASIRCSERGGWERALRHVAFGLNLEWHRCSSGASQGARRDQTNEMHRSLHVEPRAVMSLQEPSNRLRPAHLGGSALIGASTMHAPAGEHSSPARMSGAQGIARLACSFRRRSSSILDSNGGRHPSREDDARRYLVDMDAHRDALRQAHPSEDRVDGL